MTDTRSSDIRLDADVERFTGGGMDEAATSRHHWRVAGGNRNPRPIAVISGQSAYASLNEVARYPSPELGKERLLPYAKVAHSAGFSIERTDKVYAIGSCFAREIERALAASGLEVLSLAPRRWGEGLRHQHVVNNYHPVALRQDLEFALERHGHGAEGFAVSLDEAKRRWANYALGGGDAAKPGTREEVLAAHSRVLKAHRMIPDCRLVVITLGLVEAWFDRETGLYLNIAPHRLAVKLHDGRFEMHVLSYAQVLDELHRIREILARHARVKQNVLLTVSPVPLSATFRGQDVLQANAYSKAVLRAAAEEFVSVVEGVSYFPSFEFVAATDRSRAFGSRDYRHVRKAMVNVIMDATLRSYVNGLPPSKCYAQDLLKTHRYDELADELRKQLNSSESVPPFMNYYGGLALAALGRMDEAEEAMHRVAEAMPSHLAVRVALAKLNLERNDFPAARRWLDQIPVDFKPAQTIREALA